jgi:hypothetical protein
MTDTTRTVPCYQPVCRVDCVVGEWVDAGSCSSSCGSGVRKQVRAVLVSPSANGLPCPQTEQFFPCSGPTCNVDCQVGNWVNIGSCSVSCGSGTVRQHRNIVIPPVANGAACPALFQDAPCSPAECPVACIVSEWTTITSCSKSCDGGVLSKRRSIIQLAQNGGLPCPNLVETNVPCNAGPCPVNCLLSQWTAYSACSSSCGVGYQTLTRFVQVAPQYGGQPCDAQFNRTITCFVKVCFLPCVVT